MQRVRQEISGHVTFLIMTNPEPIISAAAGVMSAALWIPCLMRTAKRLIQQLTQYAGSHHNLQHNEFPASVH